MQGTNDNNGGNGAGEVMELPEGLSLGDIDWDAMMRDLAPPEWDMLLSAAAKNDIGRVRDLVINQGVPVTHSNGIGQTALHVACLWGHIEVVRFLLSSGADANATNRLAGSTPLHSLLTSGKVTPERQVALVNLLLDKGNADHEVEDSFGKCPGEYVARNHPHRQILMQRIAPPTPGMERMRSSMMKEIQRDMPVCRKAS